MSLLQSDEITQARAGSETAIAAVIAKQLPSIRAQAARVVCPGLDFDDAVQEGLIALFHAVQTYDASKGAQFATYANVCVQNALASAAKAAVRMKHAPLNNSVPLDETEIEAAHSPEEIFMQSENYKGTVQSIETLLSALEKQVLMLFIDGCTYADIAKRLNVTEKSVDNAIQRVRAKLGKA